MLLRGLTLETGFGGAPFVVAGAEYILQINSQTGATKLYKATSSSAYVLVSLGDLEGASGKLNCNSGAPFIEFYIPFNEIGYDPCDTDNPGEINIAQYASVAGGAPNSSSCGGATLDFGVELSGSVSPSQTICPGTSPSLLTVLINGSPIFPANTTVKYWEFSVTGNSNDYQKIVGTENQQNYTPGSLLEGIYYYRAQIENTDVCTSTFATSAAVITVKDVEKPVVYMSNGCANLCSRCWSLYN